MKNKFKPMLLSNDEFDLKSLDYSNMYISIKRDGVRAEITNEGIKNRSLKILRNKNIQEHFREIWSNLPDDVILEGEIYSDELPCRKIAGICNSLDKEVPESMKLYIFGIYNPTIPFEGRIEMLIEIENILPMNTKFEIVEQEKVNSYEECIELYNQFIEQGYEGAVLMDGTKPYKSGKVTIKEHIGFKLKPTREDDLEIIDVNERFENTNESQINELGYKFKRNTVDAKEGTGLAATFTCKLPNGEETKVTITGDEESRRKIWTNRNDYIGRYVVVKSMDYGIKDRLRHPRMIEIKEICEK